MVTETSYEDPRAFTHILSPSSAYLSIITHCFTSVPNLTRWIARDESIHTVVCDELRKIPQMIRSAYSNRKSWGLVQMIAHVRKALDLIDLSVEHKP